VLPLEKMIKIWVKLSVIFAIVGFVKTLIDMPTLQEKHSSTIYNMVFAYKKWTNTASCDASVASRLIHENPYVVEFMIISIVYFLIGSLRAMVTIILPYYFTTYVVGLYAY
jgi:hypothetical protein